MRYLVLTDIHANLEALEAVLADAPHYDAVLCLGDLVGYGPNPNECVACVLDLNGLVCLVGNHDLAALGELDLAGFNSIARSAARWTDSALAPAVRTFLAGLAPRLDRPEYVLAHGSPREPIWEYLENAAQGPENFDAFDGALCLVGHTHVPRVFTRDIGGNGPPTVRGVLHGDRLQLSKSHRYIVNPGGVGQPRDGNPRAAYALWDAVAGEIAFRRVSYDIPRTQAKILAAGLPKFLAERLRQGV